MTLDTNNFKSKYAMRISLHMSTDVVVYNRCLKAQLDWVDGIDILLAPN